MKLYLLRRYFFYN